MPASAVRTCFGGRAPSTETGIITAYEIQGLDLAMTELVVLSACDTARGDIVCGQGVQGLRSSFIAAVAHTVVMSLWSIPDEATSRLMCHFYEGLRRGLGRSEALKAAQRHLADAGELPWKWAAFIVQGHPGPMSLFAQAAATGDVDVAAHGDHGAADAAAAEPAAGLAAPQEPPASKDEVPQSDKKEDAELSPTDAEVQDAKRQSLVK